MGENLALTLRRLRAPVASFAEKQSLQGEWKNSSPQVGRTDIGDDGFIFLVAYLCLLSWLAKGVELSQLLARPVTSPEVDYWGCSTSKYWLAFFFFPN